MLIGGIISIIFAFYYTGEIKNFNNYVVQVELFLAFTKYTYNFLSKNKEDILKTVNDKLSSEVERIKIKINQNSDEISKHLKQAKIVFEAGINEFDNEHLLVLQKILNELQEEVNTIYEIDN
jgi:hypothetical protein